MTIRIVHASVTGATANPDVLVDGPKWDADHTVTGLENVDNTSDLNKPISTATQTALDAKQNLDATLTALAGLNSTAGVVVETTTDTFTKRSIVGTANEISVANSAGVAGDITISLPSTVALAGKTVTVATQSPGDNTTKAASTAFVSAAVAAIGASTTLNGQSGALLIAVLSGGKVTLTSNTPVPESDVAAATSVILTPADSLGTMIYDGTNDVYRQMTGELTLALDSNSGHTGYHQSGKNFDFGHYWDGSAVVVGTGPAWSSDTSRGSGAGTSEVEIYNGRMVNKVDWTVRFGSASGNTVTVAARKFNVSGGFRCSANGQTDDTVLKRFVWDLYRPALRPISVIDTTDSWSYATSTFRQANSAAGNQLAWFAGVAGRPIQLQVAGKWSGATVTGITSGIGIDSTSANSAKVYQNNVLGSGATAFTANTFATYVGYPGIGYHTGVWLEKGNTGATAYGDAGGTEAQTGMTGWSLQ
jgi:hypothetical protein